MPGPPPKPPGLRQRRNRTSTAAVLPAGGPGRPAPELAARDCPCEDGAYCANTGVLPWHPLVLAWWADVWRSPMAAEYLDADVHGLYIVADLRDQYWRGKTELAAEIRLQEQRFGLSSLDRRRLQWEIEKVTQAQRGRTPAAKPPKKAAGNPLRFLRQVK
jgi:hypothetical protein